MRPVQLNSLATAVPSHKIVQSEMADVVCGAFSAFYSRHAGRLWPYLRTPRLIRVTRASL